MKMRALTAILMIVALAAGAPALAANSASGGQAFGGQASGEKTDPEDVIAYRRHLMNILNEESGALGMILSASAPAENAAAHLQIIALTAAAALKAFAPNVPGGEARPEVWSQWGDFSNRLTAFARLTAQAADVTRARGLGGARPVILEALTCKSCHDLYRDEKRN